MKTKQKSVLLPVLITALMVVTAVSAGIWMTDPDGGTTAKYPGGAGGRDRRKYPADR